jgi:hypothetical protein
MIPKEENQRGSYIYYSNNHNSQNNQDTLYKSLNEYYQTWSIYLPHYKIDTDNWNMYFSKSNEKRFINTYKNNNKDSIWSSLTYPSLINSKDFVNPYVKADSPEMKQWEYISDSKYVSKIIETIYWAYCWSNEQKKRKFMDTILKKF